MKTQEQLFHREFRLIDKNGIRFSIEAEITTRNGYPEFTLSGDGGNSHGQVQDGITPANKHQEQLLKVWERYHLNGMKPSACVHQQQIIQKRKTENLPTDYDSLVKTLNFSPCKKRDEATLQICRHVYGSGWDHETLPPGFKAMIDGLIAEITAADDERLGETCGEKSPQEVYNWMQSQEIFDDFDQPFVVLALAILYDVPLSEIADIEEDEDRYTVQGTSYLAGDDETADRLQDEEFDNYLEECVLPNLPENARNYFDRDKWKNDAKNDGRGHALNRYDGNEDEIKITVLDKDGLKVFDEYIFSYRQ